MEAFKEKLMLVWILKDELNLLLREEKPIQAEERKNKNDSHDHIPRPWKHYSSSQGCLVGMNGFNANEVS